MIVVDTQPLSIVDAIDTQPLSIVDNGGFMKLLNTLKPRYTIPSRKYMTDTILPRILEGITCSVKSEIAHVLWFSFTTDIWSTDISSNSFLSFTAHWLIESFERKSAVLHAQSFPGEHTGELISNKYREMLAGWGIKKEQVHLIIRDNASNMVKAMKDGDIQI